MAKYKIIPSSRTIMHSPISIGHKAEKGVEAIEFDLTAWVEMYGSGTLTVIMRRWGDAIPYPIALEIGEDNKATWTLSDIDTAKAGMAYAQLNYIVGDEVVKKSDIYTFRVMDSLTGEGEPPEAYDSWLEHLTHLAAEAMAEVLDIEGIVTDKTLTVDGGIADGKATGDALALKADKSTTYTKVEVDQMIEDVEVETDTTLEIAGAPADAAETGRQIGLLKADLAPLDGLVTDVYGQSSFTLPSGYQNVSYENASHTTGIVSGADNILLYRKGNAGSVSNSGLYITDSHVSIPVDNTVGIDVSDGETHNAKFKTNANVDKYSLVLRFYKSDYSSYSEVRETIPIEDGKEWLIDVTALAETNDVNLTTYPMCVFYGIKTVAFTADSAWYAEAYMYGYGTLSEGLADKVTGLDERVVGVAETVEQNTDDIASIGDMLLLNVPSIGEVVHVDTPNVGYVMTNGREVVDDSNFRYSNLLPAVGGADYQFVVMIVGNAALVWYDATGMVISGISGSEAGGGYFGYTTIDATAPANAKYYKISRYVHQTYTDVTAQQLTNIDQSNAIERMDAKIDNMRSPTGDDALIYFACGDSITHANHDATASIPLDDPFMPTGGTAGYTYDRKNYAYYIAKRHNLKWYNYGIGGTTLTQCSTAGIDRLGFATPNGRYKNLANVTPDFISIFFGWNDKTFGPWQQRELWLAETYGSTIYYPDSASKIGTTAQDGTPYTTQAQYDACNSATGTVGGVSYDTADEYFYARFLGTIDSVDPKTWYGAWNVVISDLLLRYPFAKIMPIVPYSYVVDPTDTLGITENMKQAVRNIAEKWGLAYFDFDSEDHQLVLGANSTPFISQSDYTSVRYMRRMTLFADSVHPTDGGYRYFATMIGSKLMSL